MMTDAVMNQICAEHGITLTDAALDIDRLEQCNGVGHYDNCSFCCGMDEIILGRYDDRELREISFFHELGHCLDRAGRSRGYDTMYELEAAAWLLGLAESTKYGCVWSELALSWAEAQLASYIGYEERESRGWIPRKFEKIDIRRYNEPERIS